MSTCDMYKDCASPVTHIGEKGYVYCSEHVACRKHVERCRKMRKWERNLIARGKPVPSYKPITKAAAVALVLCLSGCAASRLDHEATAKDRADCEAAVGAYKGAAWLITYRDCLKAKGYQ